MPLVDVPIYMVPEHIQVLVKMPRVGHVILQLELFLSTVRFCNSLASIIYLFEQAL